jgi:VWFA-related protein
MPIGDIMKENIVWIQILLAVMTTVMPLAAQEPAGAEVFTDMIKVEVVNIEVFVTDKQGRPVAGLEKQDFQLLVNGEPTPITNFYAEVGHRSSSGDTLTSEDSGEGSREIARESQARPEDQLYLVIFVDCGQSMPHNRRRVFEALEVFLDSMLSPGDEVAVISYDQSLRFHGGFQSDRKVLREVLAEVKKTAGEAVVLQHERQEILSEILGPDASTFGRSRLATENAANTRSGLVNRIRGHAQSSYYHSLNSLNALQRIILTLSGAPGRRALIHVSDGIATTPGLGLYGVLTGQFGDTGSYLQEIGPFDLLPAIEKVARLANASLVTLYALDAEPDHRAIARSAGAASGSGRIPNVILTTMDAIYREPMEHAANTTGGQRVQASWRLDQDLEMIAADLGTCYSLGFEHRNPEKGKANRIEVKIVNREGLRVRHRLTFDSDTRSEDGRFAAEITAAVILGATNNRIQAQLRPEPPQRRDDQTSALPIKVILPIANLSLLPAEDGLHEASLSISSSVKDRAGNAGPIQKTQSRLRIPDDELEQARTTFAIFEVSPIIEAGDQRIVIGIRDDIAAATSTLALDLSNGGQE